MPVSMIRVWRTQLMYLMRRRWSGATGEVRQRYEPLTSAELEMWPDSLYTVDDETSPTGIRLDSGLVPWVATLSPTVRTLAEVLDLASGFGTNTAVLFRFDGPVAGSSGDGAELGFFLYDVTADPPVRVQTVAELLDEGTTLVFDPVRPLTANHDYVAVLDTSLESADGGCVAPAQATIDVLSGESGPEYERIVSLWLDGLQAIGFAPDEVTAMTAFRVQNEVERFEAIAAEINTLSLEWVEREGCVDEALWRRCEMSFEPLDYRDGKAIYSAESNGSRLVPVTIWMPLDAETLPLPIVVGHGANADRYMGEELAEVMVPEGFAIIAADAIEHGEHPQRGDGGEDFFRFLGLDLSAFQLDAESFRGNLNQTALEWAQLAQLVRTQPDIDGGGADFDSARIGYHGFSMGSLLGPGVLALSDDIDAAILSVGGGHLTKFVDALAGSSEFGSIIELLVGSPERLERLLVAGQSGIDMADPAMWAARVTHDRISGDTAPHVLLSVTIHDEIVPLQSGMALARAFGLPQADPLLVEVPSLSSVDLPTSGNLDGRTAVYAQFDTVTRDGGEPFAASHGDLPRSDEGIEQARAYWTSWRADAAPTVTWGVAD